MLRYQEVRHRRRNRTKAAVATQTAVIVQPLTEPELPRAFGVPRMTWTSVVTERAISDHPLRLRKDLQIRPLLDDPRLRRAMGLDRPVAAAPALAAAA